MSDFTRRGFFGMLTGAVTAAVAVALPARAKRRSGIRYIGATESFPYLVPCWHCGGRFTGGRYSNYCSHKCLMSGDDWRSVPGDLPMTATEIRLRYEAYARDRENVAAINKIRDGLLEPIVRRVERLGRK